MSPLDKLLLAIGAVLLAFGLSQIGVAVVNLRRIRARLRQLDPCVCGHSRNQHEPLARDWQPSRARSGHPQSCVVSWCTCVRFESLEGLQ